LRAFRIKDLITRKVSKNDIVDNAKFFQNTYDLLLSLVRHKKNPNSACFKDVDDLSPVDPDSASHNFELSSSRLPTSSSPDANQTQHISQANSPGCMSDGRESTTFDHFNDSKRSASPQIVAPPSKRTKATYSPSNTSQDESSTTSPRSKPTSPADSLESTTSCDEQYSRSFLVAFVNDARRCLRMDTLPWCDSKDIVELAFGYNPH
jgi:hypothetical protein